MADFGKDGHGLFWCK